MALPLYDGQPTRRAPLVTYALIAINVVVFLLTPMAQSSGASDNDTSCDQATFSYRYGAVPRELTTGHQVPLPGEVAEDCGRAAFHKVPWASTLTSMFLHAGWLHLLGNMVYLFVFGQATEDRFGRLRFLLFYLVCGVVAAYGFAVTYPGSTVPLIGASGAIAGILGSHLALYPRSRTISLVLSVVPFRFPAWVILGQFFALQWLAILLAPHSSTAYVAHIYGFITGLAVGFLVRSRHRRLLRTA